MKFSFVLLPLVLATVVAGAVAGPRPLGAEGSPTDQPGISIPYCQVAGNGFDSIHMFWHHVGAEPAGTYKWKVERRHFSEGEFVYQHWELNADGTYAPASIGFERTEVYAPPIFWDFSDGTASSGAHYTYRVRALNEDGSEMSGRYWSRRAQVLCEAQGNKYVNYYGSDPASVENDD